MNAECAMDDIIEHTPDITQVKVPLPFPLKWVNSYIVKGSGGVTVIDPGLHTEEAEQVWMRVLDRLRIRFGDIEQIVLTHYHPDHYGLAGWFQERTGVKVLLSRKGESLARRLWGDGRPLSAGIHALFLRHGMPGDIAAELLPHMDGFIPLVSPQPEITYISEGDTVKLGDRKCWVLETEGHAEGHLCFYDEEEQVMFCGDQVLPRITPNISYLPESDANPLKSFMQSLNDLSGYSVRMAFPGHREPFAAFAERAQEIVRHHERRLHLMLERMREPVSAYRLCRDVFGDNLSIHQLRFAMSETIAHTVYLVNEGKAAESERDGIIQYQSV